MPSLRDKSNNLPFLLVEEGLKKNLASERLCTYIGQKISERAEIEMRYIKLLDDWKEDLNPPIDHSDGTGAYLDTEIVRRLMIGMRNEASHVIETRQRIYNNIMAEDGPYSRLQGATLFTQNSPRSLAAVKEEFGALSRRRSSTERDLKLHKEAREHRGHTIEDLENQLSQRSRITSSRRPTTRAGTRKVDEMRNRLSSLRRQNEDETEKIDSLEKEIIDIDKSSSKTLDEIDRQLHELEVNRMRIIAEQTKHFLSFLQKISSPRSPGLQRGGQSLYGLDSIEGLLKVHWTDVRANARRAERGEHFRLRELFEVSTHRPKSSMDGLVTRALGGKAPASEIRGELSSKMRNQTFEAKPGIAFSFHSNRAPSDSDTESSTDTSQGSYHDLDIDNDREPGVVQQANIHPPVDTSSKESVETYELPPEVRCPAELTKLDPNRQYSTRMRLAKKLEPLEPSIHVTEFSQVSGFTKDNSNTKLDCDVGKMRNVRVVSHQDNITANTNELPFRKGQIIKQKVGENEDGLCYGWTRDSRLGKKQYGFYRPQLVSLYKKGGLL